MKTKSSEEVYKILLGELHGKCLKTTEWEDVCTHKDKGVVRDSVSRDTFYRYRRKLEADGVIFTFRREGKKVAENWIADETEELYRQKILPPEYMILVEKEKTYLPYRIEHLKKIKECVIRPWIDEIDCTWVNSVYGVVKWTNTKYPTFGDLQIDLLLPPSIFQFSVENELLFKDLRDHHTSKEFTSIFMISKSFKSNIERFYEERARIFERIERTVKENVGEPLEDIRSDFLGFVMEYLTLGFTSFSFEKSTNALPLIQIMRSVSLYVPSEKRLKPKELWTNMSSQGVPFAVEIHGKKCILHPSFVAENFRQPIEALVKELSGDQKMLETLQKTWDILVEKEHLAALLSQHSPIPSTAIPVGKVNKPDIDSKDIQARITSVFAELAEALNDSITELIGEEQELNRGLYWMKRKLEEYYRTEKLYGNCEYLP